MHYNYNTVSSQEETFKLAFSYDWITFTKYWIE